MKYRKGAAPDVWLKLMHKLYNPNNPFALPRYKAPKVASGLPKRKSA